jgi:transcriptional regulator with XRE-family HTH domain
MNKTTQRIISLSKERGVKQSYLVKLIGGYSSKVTEWKNGKSTPTQAEIEIIASALHTSTSYLLSETDDPSPPARNGAEKRPPPLILEAADREALELFRKLPPDERAAIMKLLRSLSSGSSGQ